MSVHATLVTHNAAAHRAIERVLERLETVARDTPELPALADGTAAAVTLVRGHHAYEDDLLLPLLARKGADGPWGRVADDHERLAVLLGRLERATDADREDRVAAVRELVVPHMALEEEHLTEAFWRSLLSDDEAKAFGKEVAAHSRAHLKPSTQLLPLILFNLDDEERAAFTAPMPAFVSRGLVPYAFRPMWRKLRPFMTHPPRRLTPGR